jgi:hypothetical protein
MAIWTINTIPHKAPSTAVMENHRKKLASNIASALPPPAA